MTPCQLRLAFETEIAKLGDDDRVLWLRFTANMHIHKSTGNGYVTVQWRQYPRARKHRVAVYQRPNNLWSLWFSNSLLRSRSIDHSSIAALAIEAIRERWLPTIETNRLIT